MTLSKKGAEDIGESNKSKVSYIREVTQNPRQQLQLSSVAEELLCILREWRQKNLTKIIQLPI